MADPELTALLATREVRDIGITDFFDLADALLDAASLQKTLRRLDRPTLAAVGAAVPSAADDAGLTSEQIAALLTPLGISPSDVEACLGRARLLALVDHTADLWAAYAPVTEQQHTWPGVGLPSPAELVTQAAPAALEPVSPTDARFIDTVAAEHAFATTTAIAELLAELQREPARELARGGIALPDAKRLAVAMAVSLGTVPTMVSVAARSDLVQLDGGVWVPATAAARWMLGSTADRWAHLATGWFDGLPAEIRTLLGARAHSMWGSRLADYLRWLYPAGGDWMNDRALAVTREAELLGITARQTPSTPGSALFANGPGAATEAMTPLFPPEVSGVYVQHDLSIVSPGPLQPRLDARLRGMADVESRALAATYRVSQSSINRALANGETAESLHAFLAEISLTGIPQPLNYLISGAAARFGLVRVGTADTAADGDIRSYVRSPDAAMLSTLVVDQAIAGLGIRRVAPDRAVSRFSREVVFRALNDARYPVAAEDAEGRTVVLERRRIVTSPSPAVESAAAAIVRKLRLAGEPTPKETGKAWIERQLEAAIKGRFVVVVSVRMPGGDEVDLTLEPAALAGGRLRARDRKSDLERTLPLASIIGVAPVDPA